MANDNMMGIFKGLKAVNEGADWETRTYRITADSKALDDIEKLLELIRMLGSIGASRGVTLYVDGDGHFSCEVGRVDSKGRKSPLPKIAGEPWHEGKDIDLGSLGD